MSTSANEPVKWLKVTETNEWEGETWYHYSMSDGSGRVRIALASAAQRIEDLSGPELVELTWDQAEALANLEPGYMDIHWFGELTKFDELQGASGSDLYKGKIRDYGEELFSIEPDGDGDDDEPEDSL